VVQCNPSREDALEGPEIHHPHARHGGLPRWLELSIAVTALITSISSIFIAVHHGHIMEKLVEANSFPWLQGGISDATPAGERVLSLDLFNRGVGPAHEKSLRVKVDGRYVTSTVDLIAASVTADDVAAANKVLHVLRNGVKTRFIPGGQQQFIFRIAQTSENASYWEQLERAQTKWSVEYCYCSVFEECWRVEEEWHEPQPIKGCSRDEPHEFNP
jgi:hypothetical protein